MKFKDIPIVDKTLIFIMALAMGFLIFSLFFNVDIAFENAKLNSVFRTSASAIFGYLLSGNFCSYKTQQSVENNMNLYQVIVTAFISCLCMLTLILMAVFVKMDDISTDDISTITMIRDFISGSIGFLIGNKNK